MIDARSAVGASFPWIVLRVLPNPIQASPPRDSRLFVRGERRVIRMRPDPVPHFGPPIEVIEHSYSGGPDMTGPVLPISLAGSRLGAVRHICAFFSNDDEEYRVLLPFIKEGLEHGDKSIQVVNPQQRDDHLRRLSSAGIDPAVAERTGQLEIKINTEAYLRDGEFDQDRMLETFEQLASGNAPGGFPLSRIVCRMDWVVGDRARLENVIEFESRVNDIWNRHDDAVICTYHLSQFRGDAVIDIMRTHPLVIIGGILQQNPFYVPPQEFLQEYRGRRPGAGAQPNRGA